MKIFLFHFKELCTEKCSYNSTPHILQIAVYLLTHLSLHISIQSPVKYKQIKCACAYNKSVILLSIADF